MTTLWIPAYFSPSNVYIFFFTFLWIFFSCSHFFHYVDYPCKFDGSLKKNLVDSASDVGAIQAIQIPLLLLVCTSSMALFQLMFEHYSITVKNCPEKLTELLIYPRWFLVLAINVLPVPILLLLGTGRTDNIDEVFVFCNELVSVFVNSFFDYYLRLELIFFTPVRNNYSPCSLSYSTINR